MKKCECGCEETTMRYLGTVESITFGEEKKYHRDNFIHLNEVTRCLNCKRILEHFQK